MSNKMLQKNTILTVIYTDKEHSMGHVLEALGAKDASMLKEEIIGYHLESEDKSQSVDCTDMSIGGFLMIHAKGMNITPLYHKKKTWSTSQAMGVIKGHFRQNGSTYTSVGYISEYNRIEIYTSGRDVTKSVIERQHKANVVCLKDKIVAMPFVQRVEYSCDWHTEVDESCDLGVAREVGGNSEEGE